MSAVSEAMTPSCTCLGGFHPNYLELGCGVSPKIVASATAFKAGAPSFSPGHTLTDTQNPGAGSF